jgi:hypothetical protein
MSAEGSNDSARDADLEPFIRRCHEAIAQQSHGHPEPFLELWSRADDVSIMAAIGGYQVGIRRSASASVGPHSPRLTGMSEPRRPLRRVHINDHKRVSLGTLRPRAAFTTSRVGVEIAASGGRATGVRWRPS